MKLVIDIGNTLSKIAVFEESDIIELIISEEIIINQIDNLFNNFQDINTGIIASVRKIDPELINYVNSKIHLIVLNESTPLPFKNNYLTPTSLGYDRIAAVTAAMDIFPGNDVLVINAGTCITYDIITAEKDYLGGAISPGIYMRFSSLNTFTSKLPLIKPNAKAQVELIGKNTENSILSGIQNGILYEVDGAINAYKELFPEIKVIISGGDYKYFDKNLKNNIFATPNIVLMGLNRILDLNEKK